jgi:hypothetical protein
MSKAKEQGLALTDIGPLYEDVPFGDKHIRVYGVSAKGIFSVFQRFPEIMKWFNGGVGVTIDLKNLVNQVPDALAAIIAAGCGEPGEAKAEKIAEMLPAETQLDIIEAIGRLTFRSGFGPFATRIAQFVTAAQSANFGRAPDTKSPQASKPASQPDTTPNPSGT